MSATFAEPTWGEVDPAVLSRILVVSPHFDDAAMGAGHLLASYDDTTVVTVLGGEPPAYPDEPSEWDALGGFVAGDDVVAVRREEDVAAMAVLESGYEWLEFPDHQYLDPAGSADAVRRGARPRRHHRRVRSDRRVLPDGARQSRSRDDARRLPAGAPGATRTRVVLLRGPWLQAHPRPVGLARGEALALAPLADAGHHSARARRGAQAPRHLVLHLADRAARAGPRAQRAHGGPRPGAVLAPGAPAVQGGKDWPTSSEPGRATTRPGGVGRVVGTPRFC